MIRFERGDILAADVEALVNTVNTVGVMGRGIALQVKKAFPQNFKVYEAACKRGEVETGKMLVVDTGRMVNPRWIINFPTKRHWRGDSHFEFIETGLVALVEEIKQHPAAKARFDRVAELVEGFETPFGMELLATVHWVVAQEGASTADETIAKLKAWSSRKAMFKPEHIRIAWDVLHAKGWLPTSGAQ